MKRRAFSLIEMVFVLIIVAVVATIAFPTYQNFVEDSRAQVCETNLKALKTALDIYAMENDNMPGALGQLPQEYINKAYAQVMQRPDAWKTKLAYAILEWHERGLAYAGDPNFLLRLAKGNLSMITCPGASAPPLIGEDDSVENPSYVVSTLIIDLPTSEYRNLNSTIITALTPLITDASPHHKKYTYGIAHPYSICVKRNGDIERLY